MVVAEVRLLSCGAGSVVLGRTRSRPSGLRAGSRAMQGGRAAGGCCASSRRGWNVEGKVPGESTVSLCWETAGFHKVEVDGSSSREGSFGCR